MPAKTKSPKARPILATALAAFLAASTGALAAGAGGTAWSDPTPTYSVVFRNNGERARIPVRVATTEAARERGLAGRPLPDGEGMLYDFGEQMPVRMWTKDDTVPLDMAFIGEEGVVSLVRRDLPPRSRTPIPSRVPVRYVLEVPAGTLQRLGVSPGDAVEIASAAAPARQAAPPPAQEAAQPAEPAPPAKDPGTDASPAPEPEAAPEAARP